MLNAVYGADTIANLTDSDIVSMPNSEFANFTALPGAAKFGTGAAVITAADGDTLTLEGVTTSAQLKLGRLHIPCVTKTPAGRDNCRLATRAIGHEATCRLVVNGSESSRAKGEETLSWSFSERAALVRHEVGLPSSVGAYEGS